MKNFFKFSLKCGNIYRFGKIYLYKALLLGVDTPVCRLFPELQKPYWCTGSMGNKDMVRYCDGCKRQQRGKKRNRQTI